jgi:hypothetical protein
MSDVCVCVCVCVRRVWIREKSFPVVNSMLSQLLLQSERIYDGNYFVFVDFNVILNVL